MFKKLFSPAASKKKIFLIGLSVGLICVLFYLAFFSPKTAPNVSKPPVIEINRLEVLGAGPTGNVEDFNTLFPVSVKFSDVLDPNGTGILVDITPSIPIEKYVLTTYPETLWVQPSTDHKAETYGWVDGTTYTITIKKGSKSPGGAVLQEDYSFSFTNIVSEIDLAP